MPTFEEAFKKSVNNPHDAAFKSAFQRRDIAEAFFREYLPEKIRRHIDFTRLEVVSSSFVDAELRESHSDVVYQATIAGKKGFLYILFEHQSTPDRRMAFRLLCYMVNIWKAFVAQHPGEKYLPVIFPAVLYHGKRVWHAPLHLADLINGHEDFKDYFPDFGYQLYNLGDYPDELLKLGDFLALGMVLSLMKHIFDDDFPRNFPKAVSNLAHMRDRSVALEFLEWAIRYVFHARDDTQEVMTHYIDKGVTDLSDDARRIAMSIAERFRQEGMGIGIEKGVGMGQTRVIITLLKKRFGSLTPMIERKLNESRGDVLDRFSESILDFKDLRDAEKWWDAFEKGHT